MGRVDGIDKLKYKEIHFNLLNKANFMERTLFLSIDCGEIFFGMVTKFQKLQ